MERSSDNPARNNLRWAFLAGAVVGVAGIARSQFSVQPVPSLPLRATLTHPNSFFAVAFSPDEKTLAAGFGDGTVRLFDIPEH